MLVASWDRDGTGDGYDLPLLSAIAERVSVPVIASGGARGPGDLARALTAGASAVLAASIFPDGVYTVGSRCPGRGRDRGAPMIIPSIDLKGGQVVQLIGGAERPRSRALPWPSACVAGELAVIDLDAALGTGSNRDLITPLLGDSTAAWA